MAPGRTSCSTGQIIPELCLGPAQGLDPALIDLREVAFRRRRAQRVLIPRHPRPGQPPRAAPARAAKVSGAGRAYPMLKRMLWDWPALLRPQVMPSGRPLGRSASPRPADRDFQMRAMGAPGPQITASAQGSAARDSPHHCPARPDRRRRACRAGRFARQAKMLSYAETRRNPKPPSRAASQRSTVGSF